MKRDYENDNGVLNTTVKNSELKKANLEKGSEQPIIGFGFLKRSSTSAFEPFERASTSASLK